MKENPTTAYTFFFKQIQTCLQPLTPPNSPKPWGSPCLGWAFGILELSKGETLHISPGGSFHVHWCLETSRCCSHHHLVLALSAAGYAQHFAVPSGQRFQLVLLSWGAPHTAARCYRRGKQVRRRQQSIGRTDSALQVALCSAKGSPLHLGCKLSCLWDFTSSKQPGTMQPFFRGVRLQELSNYRARFIPPRSGIKQHILQSFHYFVC